MPSRPIRVLMLGWEYPPLITGGLGTACEGLTKALSQQGVEITFVMPAVSGHEQAKHMQMYSAAEAPSNGSTERISNEAGFAGSLGVLSSEKIKASMLKFVKITSLLSPYLRPEEYEDLLKSGALAAGRVSRGSAVDSVHGAGEAESDILELGRSRTASAAGKSGKYGSDIFKEVQRFSLEVFHNFAEAEFDLIHAHDWMTYPAGMLLSETSGKPLIVHVHSVEFDRSGEVGNQQILEIERAGMLAADRVIAVSAYTRSIINHRYGIPFEKITVVHNGIEALRSEKKQLGLDAQDRQIVLFLGRITFQKGPDYFVEAAAKVLSHFPDTLFVMAGTGDMLPRLKSRVQELDIQANFSFPGFLPREKVEEMFSLADVYVMPSVSEPFGISCLEAVSKDTPVIVSRQSGVAEVLSHALKVDFWDVDKLADFIANALEHEELRSDLVDMSRAELVNLNWDRSGGKVRRVYQNLLGLS